MARGRFISLEGGEGAGKSTQLTALAAALEGRGLSVIVTREPGGSPGAEAIRALLLEGEETRWSPRAEALLFAAARSDHIDKTIKPALDRGVIGWRARADAVPRTTVAHPGARRSLGFVEAQHERAIGQEVEAAEAVKVAHRLNPQSTGLALIGQARIEKAVT